MVVTHSNGRLIGDEDVIGGVKWSRGWWLEEALAEPPLKLNENANFERLVWVNVMLREAGILDQSFTCF